MNAIGTQKRNKERSIVYQHILVVCCSTRRLLPLERVIQLARSFIRSIRSMARPTRMLFTLVYSLSFVLLVLLHSISQSTRLTERSVCYEVIDFFVCYVLVELFLFFFYSFAHTSCCFQNVAVFFFRRSLYLPLLLLMPFTTRSLTQTYNIFSNAIFHKWLWLLLQEYNLFNVHARHWDTKSS